MHNTAIADAYGDALTAIHRDIPEATRRGAQAAQDGLVLRDCIPYRLNSALWRAFRNGYLAAAGGIVASEYQREYGQ